MRGREKEEEDEECTSSETACRLAISEGHRERSEQAGASIMNGVFSLREGDDGTVQNSIIRGPATRQDRERERGSHTQREKESLSGIQLSPLPPQQQQRPRNRREPRKKSL